MRGYELACDPNSSLVHDSRIRFELDNVYFFQNDTWHTLSRFNSVLPVLAHLFNIDPSAKGSLNPIFTNGYGFGALGEYIPSIMEESIVRMFAPNLMFDEWWMPMEWVEHFAHEYGHALGLHHSYNGEQRSIQHYDFLDDAFGTCPEPYMLANPCTESVNPLQIMVCNPAPNHVCYHSPCFYGQWPGATSGLMSGLSENRYISPKSIGRFHRALSLYDGTFVLNNRHMHRYVKEKYPYVLPKDVTTNEIWDFGIKLYQNLIIKTGNT